MSLTRQRCSESQAQQITPRTWVCHDLVQVYCQFVSWCFEPSQPQRITSGLNINFTQSPSYSFHKSSHHKSCFLSLFIFLWHSTREPASSRVTYIILRAYTGTTCQPQPTQGKNRERFWFTVIPTMIVDRPSVNRNERTSMTSLRDAATEPSADCPYPSCERTVCKFRTEMRCAVSPLYRLYDKVLDQPLANFSKIFWIMIQHFHNF